MNSFICSSLSSRNIKPKQLGQEVSILHQRQAVSHQHRGEPGPGEAAVSEAEVWRLGESDKWQDDHQEWWQDWWEWTRTFWCLRVAVVTVFKSWRGLILKLQYASSGNQDSAIIGLKSKTSPYFTKPPLCSALPSPSLSQLMQVSGAC